MPGAHTPWEDISQPGSGISRRMRLNMHGKPALEFHAEQDCTEILEINKALMNEDNSSGSLWAGRDWVRVAQIPLLTLEKWRKEDGIDWFRWNDEDKAKIIARLNDNSYSKLRTAPGRI